MYLNQTKQQELWSERCEININNGLKMVIYLFFYRYSIHRCVVKIQIISNMLMDVLFLFQCTKVSVWVSKGCWKYYSKTIGDICQHTLLLSSYIIPVSYKRSVYKTRWSNLVFNNKMISSWDITRTSRNTDWKQASDIIKLSYSSTSFIFAPKLIIELVLSVWVESLIQFLYNN